VNGWVQRAPGIPCSLRFEANLGQTVPREGGREPHIVELFENRR